MNTWFTADTHFNHKNIIKYCDRPFDSVEEMNTILIDNWNSSISPGDIVYHLGDVFMGKPNWNIINQLNGQKYLVLGNHDEPFKRQSKYVEWSEYFTIVQGCEVYINEQHVTLNHFPFAGDSRDNDRFTDSRPIDNGQYLLHGHIHDVRKFDHKQFNVGVDVNNYKPVSDTEVINWINAIENFNIMRQGN